MQSLMIVCYSRTCTVVKFWLSLLPTYYYTAWYIGLGRSEGNHSWITIMVELGGGCWKISGVERINWWSRQPEYQSDDILQPLLSSGNFLTYVWIRCKPFDSVTESAEHHHFLSQTDWCKAKCKKKLVWRSEGTRHTSEKQERGTVHGGKHSIWCWNAGFYPPTY